MNAKMAVIAILVSAVITFGLRALPFLVFQEGKELPDKIKRLGMVLPFSITAVSYKWKHNTLISILLGTVSYMLFLHLDKIR